MLLDELNSTVKKLSQLDKKESAIQNAEKKIKNDRDYHSLTLDFSESMNKLSYAHTELEYSLSDETIQLIDDSLKKLYEIIDAGVVDEELLQTTKTQITRKLNPALTREWKEFYSKKTNNVVGKLATIGSLAPDKNRIDTLRNNISESGEWSSLSDAAGPNTTKIMRFKSSIIEVDKIEEQLNLNDDIKNFIALVTRGKAKITDLNDEIISWIKQENLEDKFTIRFR